MKSDVLAVPGAEIYYEVSGSGPLLLILQGGDGDAGRTTDLVNELTPRFTVVTYDRRGLSRSRPKDPGTPTSMWTHADDVHHLLAGLGSEPAAVFGTSFGAFTGLHLALRHPGQMTVLVAHEPPAFALLPAAERAAATSALTEVQQTFHTHGAAEAMSRVAPLTGIDIGTLTPAQREALRMPSPERQVNMSYFLANDLSAILHADFGDTDGALLRAGPVPVVPAVGALTPTNMWDHRCARELAALLDTDVVELPGGHNGPSTHPRELAPVLADLVAGA